MPSKKTKSPAPEVATRDKILAAAGEMLASGGLDSVSMRKVADRIEFSPTTIYIHFKDKDELIQSVCDKAFDALSDKFLAAEIDKKPPLTGLREGLRIYVDHGLKHASEYEVVFMTRHDCKEPYTLQQMADSSGGRAFAHLRRAVERCVLSGVFPATDLETASQILWAGVHGITSLLITQQGFPWVEKDRVIDTMIERLTAGFLVELAESPR